MQTSLVDALFLLATLALLAGCGRAEPAGDARAPSVSPAAAKSADPAVELTPSQLAAIQVAPVGLVRFPVVREAPGSVCFDEDPAIVQAESTLLGAFATCEATRREWDRVRTLGETNGIAPRELEQATADHQTATAALKAARDAVRALGKTDDDIDALLAAGRIPSAPAGERWVMANVAESDSPLLHDGQAVQVTVTALPNHPFAGTIAEVYGMVDATTHRVSCRCTVKDSRRELRPGMLADVVIAVRDPVESPAVPADAVVRESDGTMTAWVTTDRKRFVQRILKTGLRAGDQVQILDGLQRGELAVTGGAVFVSNLFNAPPGD